MKRHKWIAAALLMTVLMAAAKSDKETFPDGSVMPAWFADTSRVDTDTLGRRFVVTDHGVKNDSTKLQTGALQRVIDMAAESGGGVVVIPRGTFLSGSLFFRQGTHLYIEKGGVLKGSERIRDFKVMKTRIEGETCTYFAALVNADGVDGFTIAGKGTIDGNGRHYWEEFWIRRRWNPECTNKDAQRPRLVYISNSCNVTVQDVRLVNSPFWTNHIYRCHHVRFLGCHIFAPTEGIKAPSSDAIDIDACHDVLIDGCYMSVNDDAVVLKGGKGTFADKDPDNGPCRNIVVQNCTYGRVHGCLTLGSESLHDRNVVLRRCRVQRADRVLWLKMRPDTPQHYEYITVEDLTGNCGSFIVVRPWTQFFKMQERPDMPLSQCNDVTVRRVDMDCRRFLDIGASDKYRLADFIFEDCNIRDGSESFDTSPIENCKMKKFKRTVFSLSSVSH
ncbi:rhamnogalacturonidase [Xylanibacter caecicola]|uniref:rhamnogalacturonidase n=1 Tax=Xylanibacter caecicola TaxID=2736294 RepID=UPI0025901281|nr:glycosyl hydrolase family 28 protein [Xylanibacter caecicola]